MQRSWIIQFVACLFLLPLYIFATPILKLLGQRKDVAELTGKFTIRVIPQMFSLAINFPTQKFLQAQSKVGVLAWIGFAALIMHIGVLYLFANVFKWGLVGAAISYDVSQFGSLLWVSWLCGWLVQGRKDRIVLVCLQGHLGLCSALYSFSWILFLQIWYFMAIIVLTGHLEDPIIATGSLPIW
ncbi:PREDICTED: protein TRANSPARENT TESTA 12-like [Populus euphratica]|uniref:Protein TRANSPARENT TESTA 12-like n=1 Tax=Populus euphratica TaxID=75702 RepID=A0AAJ6Y4W0_POPEU|nr:PREDICTED: protein TRANSPARENT TESTA 12-like [Populus euphratica]